MNYSWLPPRLAEIAEIVGLDAALRLAEIRGGARLMFPRTAKPDHWLVQELGSEKAQALCDHFSSTGGVPVEIPLGPTGSAAGMRQAIDRLIADGLSAEEIARRLRVSARNVRRRRTNLGNAEQDPDQGRLF
ncbi:hypothetical protein [Kaistia sp. MMO-174]|uniref:hypothetical protein n=1 Tax=Kaistia sp. MMO-174 TaxID=3081256 RepID=UPI00301937A7